MHQLDGRVLGTHRFTPRQVSSAARFAKEVSAAAVPESPNRAKAFLFAASRLGAFGEAIGLDLSPEVLFHPSVIERMCTPGGWCRLMGSAKNALVYALGVVVRNVRITVSFESRIAEDAHRGPLRKRRHRRHRKDAAAPDVPAPDDAPSEPG